MYVDFGARQRCRAFFIFRAFRVIPLPPKLGSAVAMLWGSLRCPASVLEIACGAPGTPAASLGPPRRGLFGRLSPPRRSAITFDEWVELVLNYGFFPVFGLAMCSHPRPWAGETQCVSRRTQVRVKLRNT